MNAPNNRTQYRHITKRCTNEAAVTEALDEGYSKGFKLLGTCSADNGSALWLFFQAATVVQAQPAQLASEPAPAPAPAPPLGGSFDGPPATQ